jgi:hypothetical protein
MIEFEDEDDINDEGGADPLEQLKADTLKGMREYLAGQLDGGGEAGYTSADIGECGRILDAYLATVEEAAHYDEETMMGAVEFTVRSLNRLNARCGGSLIETEQRGPIVELIAQAAARRGVGTGLNDLTQAWREW